MPRVFKNSHISDYKLSETGSSIVMASQNVSFEVTIKSEILSAKIVDLQVTVEGTELQMSVTTVTDISPGIRAFCQTQSFLGMQLVNKADGTQTLGYFDSRPAVKNNWTEADSGFKITEEILAAIGLLLAAVAVVVTGGAAIGVAAMIISLAAGVISVTELQIAKAGKDDASSIGDLVLNSMAAFVWPDSKDFKLSNAKLSDSLQLGGTLLT